MSSDRKTANAVGGKTARACDSCMRKRARWYCTADDAFLCQACDASVHSANSLARRHERVRLKNASFKPPKEESQCISPPPAWHQGFTRKARTPRTKPNKIQDHVINPLPLVPEMGSDVTTPEENDEQLLYQVPIFDPFEAEFCASTVQKDAERLSNDVPPLSNNLENDSKSLLHDFGNDEFGNLHGLLPSDMDLADFAADVETLLGTGLDEDSFGMEGLGLLESREEDNHNIDMYYESGRVKMEDEEDVKAVVTCHMDPDLVMARETLELNFDCESPTTGEEEDEEKVRIGGSSSSMTTNHEYKIEEMARKISLRLDYNAVIDAWSSQGLPWMTGDPPQFNPEDCWSDGLGLFSTEGHHLYGSDTSYIGGAHMGAMGGDGGREARVSRYREKRRTRLFSKKIRYEVRKLNAEKRPRMKGRFVKRTSFVGVGGPGFPF